MRCNVLVVVGNRLGIQKSFSRSNLPEAVISCVRLKAYMAGLYRSWL